MQRALKFSDCFVAPNNYSNNIANANDRAIKQRQIKFISRIDSL